MGEGEALVRVKAAPAKGQANEELIRVLANYFHVPRHAVVIISGASSPWKRVEINGVDATRQVSPGGKK